MKYFVLFLSALVGTAFLAGCGGGGPGMPGVNVAEEFLELAAEGDTEEAEELLHPLKHFRYENELERVKFDEAVEEMEKEFDEDEKFTLIDYDVSDDARNASYTFSYDKEKEKVTILLKEFKGDYLVFDFR
ncbi:MAG: hypothetical protein ACFBZ8_05250 [Opitutales bacterium]